MSDLDHAPMASRDDKQRAHDLRNAINSAGLCVHAAQQLLSAGDIAKALDNLRRAAKSIARARNLLAPGTDVA